MNTKTKNSLQWLTKAQHLEAHAESHMKSLDVPSNSHLIACLTNLMNEVMMDEAIFSKITPCALEHARNAISKYREVSK